MSIKPHTIIQRLEHYTLKHPSEVFLVTATVNTDENQTDEDQVVVFRGFSSSLSRPTAFDPDVPVLDEYAEIVSVDRLNGPYNPDNPDYIQVGMSFAAIDLFLRDAGA